MSIVHRNRVFAVEIESVRLRDGRQHELAIVRHPPSVVLIPMQDDRHVVLVRQYRHALGREIWELPAGSLDPGESAEAAAARECEEEIGLAPGRIERLGGFHPTPGYCDEQMIFFRISDLRRPAADSVHRPDEDEDIRAEVFPISEARALVARGEIVDLKTAYGLTLVD